MEEDRTGGERRGRGKGSLGGDGSEGKGRGRESRGAEGPLCSDKFSFKNALVDGPGSGVRTLH